jgi:hypothetical protein
MDNMEEKEVRYAPRKKKTKHIIIEAKMICPPNPSIFTWMDKWGNWRRYDSMENAEKALAALAVSHKEYEFRIKDSDNDSEHTQK